MNFTAKKLLLIDGIGACITALLLSQVLTRFEPLFGMPKEVLFVLAAVAVCFAVYDAACYFLIKSNHSPALKPIMTANAIYCMVTFGLVIIHFDTLTWLGIAYFIGEIALVSALIFIEYRSGNKPPSKATS